MIEVVFVCVTYITKSMYMNAKNSNIYERGWVILVFRLFCTF